MNVRGYIGDVYDLNIDDVVSDLTATFELKPKRLDRGVTVHLNKIHFM